MILGYYTSKQPDEALRAQIGGKARNLYRLQDLGLTVPRWVVIPQESMEVLVPMAAPFDYAAIRQAIDAYVFDEAWLQGVADYFPSGAYLAVRSSAIDEDGSDHSFAGQFESYLYVTRASLGARIKQVWISALADRVQQYREHNGLVQKPGIAVIVQLMVEAEVAGVGFGMDPTTGDRQSKIISAVYGLGEGLVSGELDADNYWVKNGSVEAKLVHKTHRVVVNQAAGGGTIIEALPTDLCDRATLSDAQVLAVAQVLDITRKAFGKPQDIEFAFADNQLFLLQARPITNLNRLADRNGDYILWDNSNIVESYPGVTTPLTFSFISQSYEGAYKMFSAFMGVESDVIRQNERVFANTLGLINGRVYYNLKTWYHMLAMLPGYSINARFMEKMMGVKERFDIPDHYRLSKGAAWWRIVKMAGKMYGRFLSLPRQRRDFMVLLNATIAEYKAMRFDDKNANELMQLYLRFEQTLLNEWKAPLLNDFFAMIWFGMLQKRCVEFGFSQNPNVHNDLLCGSSDIISTQPIHRSIELSTHISVDAALKALFLSQNEVVVWQTLSQNNQAPFIGLKKEIDRYIADFGERCIGELKLETISYTQSPPTFIKVLQSYVQSGITAQTTSDKVENTLRSTAERELNEGLRFKFIKKWRLKRTLRLARELVSSRENLRYERTRAFGIVRELFSSMGRCWYAEGIIDDARDIFYLTKEEILSFIEGTAVSQNVKGTIELRKKEYAVYQKMEVPSERFASYGIVYHGNDFMATDRLAPITGDLKGIGCCPGRVRAKARVVINPGDETSLDGDILVASSTDPGWVVLFPGASAIIVERGSLLSHSAIVSREMGKPCIVGVTGLLKTIKTGDLIEMDGSTGEIVIVEKVGGG
jgi:rifampicin phosphotransferase